MPSTLNITCPSSLLPYTEHDEAVLRLLAMPVSDLMIQYIARKLTVAVGAPGHQHLPTPPVTPVRGRFALNSAPCAPEWEFPPLEEFIANLVSHSEIHTASILGSMIYLKRILNDLQSSNIKHGSETPYRLAVALFIVSSKYHHDIAPSTAHWSEFTAAALGLPSQQDRPSHPNTSGAKSKGEHPAMDESSPTGSTSLGYMFGPEATAALERDVLFLLGYNMHFDEEELSNCLNDLSSHPRAEGPIEELQMGQGRPIRRLRKKRAPSPVKTQPVPMRRAIVALKSGSPERSRRIISTPYLAKTGNCSGMPSPPCTPATRLDRLECTAEKRLTVHKVAEQAVWRTKPSLEVNVKHELASQAVPSRLPNPWPCSPYPLLNAAMDVNYFSKIIHSSALRNPFAPIGVPPAPPSTPIAGIDSLPFIYGGQVPVPALSRSPTIEGLIVAPEEDSPWAHGQVGEILRRAMARQARLVAAKAANPPRPMASLDTPPLLPIFGSGLLYKENPERSTVEPARVSKLMVSDVRWYYSLKQPIPAELFEDELRREVKSEMIKLGLPMPVNQYDGLPIDTTGRKAHPAILSPAPPSHERAHSIAEAAENRPKTLRAVVCHGGSSGLNNRWDKKIQHKLAAEGQTECEDQFKTTAPLRLVNKHRADRRKEIAGQAGRSSNLVPGFEDNAFRRGWDESAQTTRDGTPRRAEWEMGVYRALASAKLPPEDRSGKIGWFGRLMKRNKSTVNIRSTESTGPVRSQDDSCEDDIQILHERRPPFIVASSGATPDIVQTYLSFLREVGTWAEVNYATGCDAQRANWPAGNRHWNRVIAMAAAYHGGVEGADEYIKNPDLRNALSKAMEYWFANDFSTIGDGACMDGGGKEGDSCPCGTPGLWNTNWYSNVIIVPTAVGKTCLLLRDTLTLTELGNCTHITARAYTPFFRDPQPGYVAGANIMDIASIGISGGILENNRTGNASRIMDAYDRVHNELVIHPEDRVDGVKPDGSFQQHIGIIYNGNCGWVFAGVLMDLEQQAAGTVFQASEASRGVLGTLVEGTQWMIFADVATKKLHWDYTFIPRFIAFAVADRQATSGIGGNLTQIRLLGDAWNQPELQKYAKDLSETPETASPGDLTGNRMFWNSDYMVHRTKEVVTTVKLISNRMKTSECVNTQNPYGFHLSDGATYQYITSAEYHDMYATFDWDLVPGSTTDYSTTVLSCALNSVFGIDPYAGGVSAGDVGVAAMRYINPQTQKFGFNKAWFFFGDNVQHVLVNTALAQRSNLRRWYIFPDSQGTKLWVEQGEKTGDWKAIGTSTQPPYTKDMFSASIEHDPANLGAPIEYSAFPATTSHEAFQEKASQ